MILEQDVFHAFKPLEYFQGGNQNTPGAVRMPNGWVLSGSLPSPIVFETPISSVLMNT